MSQDSPINLAYWGHPPKNNLQAGNYGDLLSPYIVEKLSGRVCGFYDPAIKRRFWSRKDNFMAIGSIVRHCDKKSTVWGSGIIRKNDKFPRAKFLAVRGPETRERILELGYPCPEIYGDPAILMPNIYQPKVSVTHKLGIIPHVVDYDLVSDNFEVKDGIKLIDFRQKDVEQTTREILSCASIISSSLHGVIVSHAYGIPAKWIRFADSLFGDGVKFKDYFRSVNITPYLGELISPTQLFTDFKAVEITRDNLPTEEQLILIREQLMNAFPFTK